MSFQKFKELGYDITEQEALVSEKRIAKSYRQAIKELSELVAIQYATLAGVSPENYYNEMLKYDRLDKLLFQVSKAYGKTTLSVKNDIIRSSSIGIANNYYRQTFANSWISNYSFTLLPNDIVALSVIGSDKAWQNIEKSKILDVFGKPANYKAPYATISDLIAKNKTAELTAVQDAITQGLVQGKSSKSIAKEISRIIGSYGVIDGQVKTSGAIANAVRIARTELNRTMNDAAFAAQKSAQVQGIDIKKQWSATLDMRTRPAHAKLDGQIREIDKPFSSDAGLVMRPGQFATVGQNINCRCTTVDIINDQSPKIRRGRNPSTGKNEVFTYKNFDKWAKDNGLKYNKSGRLVEA